ncbi:hypothetical protein [Pleomorphomonas sp. PLEO]|uniref:hypothetical protein n=1 Tax=Pleomorphomonas sp. PLEO TaxID=3239306 RepID=UPI00351EB8FF
MKLVSLKASFAKESDLCTAFIAALPEGWTPYPETDGFDLILVRDDGAQVGIEAKLVLNAKVLIQAVDHVHQRWNGGVVGPDFLAVLIPYGHKTPEMVTIAGYLGLAVIEQHDAATFEQRYRYERFKLKAPDCFPFSPGLPDTRWSEDGYRNGWRDQMPAERCKLPAYVPDVVAGASAPSTLSEWKISAIKLCILLEKRGEITSMDFKTLHVHRQRWLDGKWITPTDRRGHYVVGSRPLNLRAQHPINYAQIEADFEKWAPAAALGATA